MDDYYFQVLQMHVPAEHFDAFIETMKHNDCKVDDLCSVSRAGRVVNVWIPRRKVEVKHVSEKVGDWM